MASIKVRIRRCSSSIRKEYDRKVNSSDLSFKEWARTWLQTYKKGKVSENTFLYTYENTVEKHLIPYFGEYSINEIRPVNVQEFFALKIGYSQTILNKMKMFLNDIFKAAIENGLCCFIHSVQKQKNFGKKPRIRTILSDSQIQLLEKLAWEQERYDVVFLLETGVRRGEMLGLQWRDLDIENSSYTIARSIANKKGGGISIEPPKWGSYRTNPLTAIAFAAANAMPKISDYIFPNQLGEPQNPNTWSQKLARFIKKVHEDYPEIPIVTAHELRHTYGTKLRRCGVDIYTIQKIMGHKDITVTSETYVHNELEVLMRASRQNAQW